MPTMTPDSTSEHPPVRRRPTAFALARARRGHAVVIVVGDVGRSPRMQYHALSLAEEMGFAVTLVGDAGEACFAAVRDEPRIREVRIAPFASRREKTRFVQLPTPLFRVVKLVVLAWRLAAALRDAIEQESTEEFIVAKEEESLAPKKKNKKNASRRRAVDVVLAQTPPAIPTLFVAWAFARVARAACVFDWHNLGYTLLADAARAKRDLSKDASLPWLEKCAVSVYETVEKVTGRWADSHLCVTEAMRRWLESSWGIKARVARDRPPRFFAATTAPRAGAAYDALATDLATRLAVFSDKPLEATSDADDDELSTGSNTTTPVARALVPGGGLMFRKVALAVSSTSWSPDEDFDVLLRGLRAYDAVATTPLLVVVTGKGARRAAFERAVAEARFRRVDARCAWLESRDYVKLLALADFGVSLHASSSGIDLPMKVVDMFGANLPVLALDFPAMPELVKHQYNGLLFRDDASLCAGLLHLLTDFHHGTSPALDQLRPHARFETDWHAMWRASVLPLLTTAATHPAGTAEVGGVKSD